MLEHDEFLIAIWKTQMHIQQSTLQLPNKIFSCGINDSSLFFVSPAEMYQYSEDINSQHHYFPNEWRTMSKLTHRQKLIQTPEEKGLGQTCLTCTSLVRGKNVLFVLFLIDGADDFEGSLHIDEL